jgi:hypothetical protein
LHACIFLFIFYVFLVGIGWKEEQIDQFLLSELELTNLIINLQISCNNDDLYTVDLIENRKRNALGFYFMVLSLSTTKGWESFRCPMTFENLSYSSILTTYDQKHNEEFSNALEQRISSIYTKSYIFKYYNTEIRNTNGIVFFYNISKRQAFKNDRFTVLLKIPDKTKPYFNSSLFWDTNFGPEWFEWIPAYQISQFINGTPSTNSQSDKTTLYTPPFSISFRSQGIEGNYFSFTHFNRPNLEDTILTMMVYDGVNNTFLPFFDPYLMIPYKRDMSLTQDLEFKILDANRKHVHISDNSQLFFILTMI